MAWEKVVPHGVGRRNLENTERVVRASFSKNFKNNVGNRLPPSLRIYIGINIATTLYLTTQDSLDFFVDEENPKRWLLKKAKSGCGSCFRIKEPTDKYHSSLSIQLTWFNKKWIPTSEDYGVRNISHKFEEGGIIVEFDGLGK